MTKRFEIGGLFSEPPEAAGMIGGDSDGERPGARTAALIVVPLFLLGAGNVVLILQWGLNPVWGLLLFPPVFFISAIGWIAISGGLADGDTSG